MNNRQQIVLWSGIIALGLFVLAFGPRPHFPISLDDPMNDPPTIEPSRKVLTQGYFEVTDGCGPYFVEDCLNARSGPGIDYPVITRLRRGVVLQFDSAVENEGRTWYRVSFDEWLRYPERNGHDMYVASEFVRAFETDGASEVPIGTQDGSAKRIIIDRSEQMLYAYDDGELFMSLPISTGIQLTPTPRGTFSVYKKTPSRYMQGPIPGISEKVFDLPGVPWNLYFTAEGAVIHGAYWHDKFGQPWSNGCVNLPPEKAHQLYDWAGLGTLVIVQD